MTELYWPGKDYPDREVWLKKRTTPRNLWKQRGHRINVAPTLSMGINARKRLEEAALGGRGRRLSKKHPGGVIAQRHKFATREQPHETE